MLTDSLRLSSTGARRRWSAGSEARTGARLAHGVARQPRRRSSSSAAGRSRIFRAVNATPFGERTPLYRHRSDPQEALQAAAIEPRDSLIVHQDHGHGHPTGSRHQLRPRCLVLGDVPGLERDALLRKKLFRGVAALSAPQPASRRTIVPRQQPPSRRQVDRGLRGCASGRRSRALTTPSVKTSRPPDLVDAPEPSPRLGVPREHANRAPRRHDEQGAQREDGKAHVLAYRCAQRRAPEHGKQDRQVTRACHDREGRHQVTHVTLRRNGRRATEPRPRSLFMPRPSDGGPRLPPRRRAPPPGRSRR